jgi:hypothetical protein
MERFTIAKFTRRGLPLHMSRPAEKTEIRIDGPWRHLAAIIYFAVLAYPSDQEWRKRDLFVQAYKAKLCKHYIRKHPGERATIFPSYRGFKNEHMDGILNRAIYRIRCWRLLAAKLASEKIIHGQWVGRFQIRVIDPEDSIWQPRSMRAMHDRGAKLLNAGRWENHRPEKEFGWTINNVRSRIWKSSLPVLHLALSFPAARLVEDDPLLLINQPSWVKDSLVYAELLRPHLRTWFPSYVEENAVRLIPTDH